MKLAIFLISRTRQNYKKSSSASERALVDLENFVKI